MRQLPPDTRNDPLPGRAAGASSSPPSPAARSQRGAAARGSRRPRRTSIEDAAYDVPVAFLQALADGLRRYGPRLVAFLLALLIVHFVLGSPNWASITAALPTALGGRR